MEVKLSSQAEINKIWRPAHISWWLSWFSSRHSQLLISYRTCSFDHSYCFLCKLHCHPHSSQLLPWMFPQVLYLDIGFLAPCLVGTWSSMEVCSPRKLKHFGLLPFALGHWSHPLHHGCAGGKSPTTAWCYHVNTDQNLRGMLPAPCWIYATKNWGSSEGKRVSNQALARCKVVGECMLLCFVLLCLSPSSY